MLLNKQKKVIKLKKHNLKKIKGIRKRLDKVVIKYGLHSIETRRVSDEIDIKINEYYKSIEQVKYPKNSIINILKNKSYQALKEDVIKNKKFPTVKQWNKLAKEKGYLIHIALEYIMKTNWNNLRVKTLRELNIEE